MHWVEFEDFRLPVLIGGHPALDFCNTWAGWGEPPAPGREWLPTYERLAAWTGYAGLLPPDDVGRIRRAARRDRDAASHVLAAAHTLRRSVHDAALDSFDQRALRRVSTAAGTAIAASTLRRSPEGRIAWTFTRDAGLDLPRLAVARAAADLLTGPDSAHVRACPGDDCGWLFVDRSGRRRWCSMSACGNRAKVRRHAERRRRA
ncbi:MAG: CGNR zinc finger domain-containing protein [Actinomycetota bacterium]|nr:CGNR zinc finger domain-containing protein [Actinomycetota bacterium]